MRPTRRSRARGRRSRPGALCRPRIGGGCCAGSRRSSRSTPRSSRRSSRGTSASRYPARAARSGWSPTSSTSTPAPSTSTTARRFRSRGGVDMTFREPLGVVGLIVPWNFPLNIASWKLGPALACGNTVVLKPAELTPLSALRLAELALEAGIPEGVMNVLVGKGSVVGQRLVEHPDVAKIGFTGSTEVGRGVMQGAADDDQARHARARRQVGERRLRRRRPREGGRRRAVRRLRQRGQDCCARSRILVERSAYDRFAELLVDRDARREGRRPDRRRNRDGPADLRAASRDRRELRRRPSRSSAATRPTARASGSRARSSRRRTTTAIAREEVFGPVAALIPFDDEADAIRIANDTPYGLSGSIWTENGAARFASRARSRPACSASTPTARCASRRRSAASSSPASAASSACTRSTATRK